MCKHGSMMPKKSMPVAWENRTLQLWRDSKFHKLHKMRNMTWFTRLKNMETMGNRDVDWNENNQALKEADDAQKVVTHPPQQEFQKKYFHAILNSRYDATFKDLNRVVPRPESRNHLLQVWKRLVKVQHSDQSCNIELR